MDSQSGPSASVPLAPMFHNATIDKAEGSEFNNTARDMFKIVLNYYNHNSRSASPTGTENPPAEFNDAINYLLNTVPLLVEEVRKNDQSRSTTVAEPTSTDSTDTAPRAASTDHTSRLSIVKDPVDIIDIIPPEPSLLPVSSIADRYTRSMLKCLVGYPLYNPIPFSELSEEYLRSGVNIGDVGFVRGNGTFDFLFNICPSKNGLINPHDLPDSFSFKASDPSATTNCQPLPRNAHLFQSPITQTKSGEYMCEGSEGAILELPDGAIEEEATNARPFAQLAARHGIEWYEYTMNRGRDISNGSLYLITSFTKCAQWGIAVFDRPCAPHQGLKFEKKRSLPFGKSTPKYHWKSSGAFPAKVSNLAPGDAPNQCVFIRGYKIMIRQDIFHNLCKNQPESHSATPSLSSRSGSISITRQRASRIRGGGGPDLTPKLTSTGLFSRTTAPKSEEEVVLHPNFYSSLIHPSDIINASLLIQNPDAKFAITHDDVWRDLLRDSFPKFNFATLRNIAQVYSTPIDEHGYVSLIRISDSSNVCVSRNRTIQGAETFILRGPPNDEGHTSEPITLPRELLERILLSLDTDSMLTCRLVNREFTEVIQSSTSLQYFLACKAAGVVDNPKSPLLYVERLEALNKREDAWRNLKPQFQTTVKNDDQHCRLGMFLALAWGNYLCRDKKWKNVYNCRLPSSLQDKPSITMIPSDRPGPIQSGAILGGTAVYEYDLIVNVVSSEVENQEGAQLHSIDLYFLNFSMGEYHVLALHPRIHIERLNSSSAKPGVVARIGGNNLALILLHNRQNDTIPNKLFIFDWKTGHKRLQREPTENSYSDLVFVSPELLLVPNLILSCLEIWYLPPSDSTDSDADYPSFQILSLGLPALSDGYSIRESRCYGELSPLIHSMSNLPSRAFLPSQENSICIVEFYFGSHGHGESGCYILVIRRCAFLREMHKWFSPPLFEPPESWTTNEIGSVKHSYSGTGSIISHSGSSSQAGDSLATTQISPTSALHVPTQVGVSAIPTGSITPSAFRPTSPNILRVKWAEWGPPVSRWLNISSPITPGCRISAGQRCAFFVSGPHGAKLRVVDFNPYNVRRNSEIGPGVNKAKNEGELEILDHKGLFSEEVYMGLKCVVSDMPGDHKYVALLMDEERLSGLKFTPTWKESIEVLYFG